MGLKYASVRQPYVVVMAPALTESGEPQVLSLSSPVSLIFSDRAEDDAKYDFKPIKGYNNLTPQDNSVVMNGDSEHKRKCAINFCDKDSIVDNTGPPGEYLDQGTPKESEYSLLQIGGFMMNNSYPGTEGSENNMGLQKSDCQIPVDSCNYLKMDLFKNLSSGALPPTDITGGGDLGHNVDEIMQVIKNMESKGNDIEENLINDGNDITGSLSTFEREFFNDVDMINMCEDDNLGESALASINKDTVIKDKLLEVKERQFKIERKCEWLVRRLRKIQARALGNHASQEITGMLQYVSNTLTDSNSPSKSVSPFSASVNKGECDRTRDIKSLNVSTLVKRLDLSSQQQALAMSQNHSTCKYFGSGRPFEPSSSKQCLTGSILPKLKSDVQKELDNVSGQLSYQLKVVEHGIDSDVTASSSGGESCDEMQCFSNPQQLTLAISKRAAWRWAQDRAAIASRWSWLSAQIHDLECRIRQNKEVNRQIRTGKGSVLLDGEDPPSLCDSVVVNGYHGPLPGTTGKGSDEDVPESVCRTRPMQRSSFRKRKLLRTVGLHLTSKRAAKPSTVQCGCHPPLPSCVLCTGRPNPTLPRQDTDLLTVNERIALLDPAFHPVLSLPCDISQSLHFDALMKTTEWQMKAQRLQMKSASVMRVLEQLPAEDLVVSESKPPLVPQRRRYFRRNLATALTDKIKKKLAKGKREQNNYALELFKSRRRFSSHKVPGLNVEERELDTRLEDEDAESSCSYTVVSGVSRPSPVPSPSHGPHASKVDSFRRKRENSYDIDNIVIPYSVAASTRLEKLQYKEILTPKWRVVPLDPFTKTESKNNGLIRRLSTEDGDIEDLSEDGLISRHERSEQLEKKKFSTYLKLPHSMARARSLRRGDSRAESSGGNTPDPMSPGGADGGGSPITSPPATPQPLDTEHYSSGRRRTTSSRCVSPDLDHDDVPPYELRTFPLTDDTYEKMLRLMPPGHPFKAHPVTHGPSSRDSECESRPVSPLSDSTESADSCIDEDPNDPEWTVDEPSVDPFKR